MSGMTPDEPTIVAFLQNQWFRDPERVKQIIADTVAREADRGGKAAAEVRRFYIAAFLFMGCLTGRRLTTAFGEHLCEQIVWEEASPDIGGRSSSAFPADPTHMAGVITELQPSIVLAFGKIAINGVNSPELNRFDFHLITGPHPAARGPETVKLLGAMARNLRAQLGVHQ